MTDEPALDEAQRLQAAQDWAYSIQQRFAEELSADIARDAQPSDTTEGPYRTAIVKLLTATGLGPDEIEEVMSSNASPKQNEFDEPHIRDMVQRHINDVASASARLGFPPLSRTIFPSSLPSGLINAFCCSNTWDPEFYYIFVDADLIIFGNSFAKIVATCLTSGALKDDTEEGSIERSVRNADALDMTYRTADLFGSYVFQGFARASRPWLPPAEAVPMQMALVLAMHRFVVAHEVAHLQLGHIDNPEMAMEVSSAAVGNAEALLFSHDAEYAADAVGTLLSMKVDIDAGRFVPTTICAPYIFLKGLEILEACLGHVGSPHVTGESTHPPASERARRVRQVLLSAYANIGLDTTIVSVLDGIDAVIAAIGRNAGEIVIERANGGEVPRKRKKLKLFGVEDRPAILGLRAAEVPIDALLARLRAEQ